MKKTILILLFNLFLVITMNAQHIGEATKIVDTLPRVVVNGLDVIPIRTYTFTDRCSSCSDSSTTSQSLSWKLRTPSFYSSFQEFGSKYAGVLKKKCKDIYDWEDQIWKNVIPGELKELIKTSKSEDVCFEIFLYVDKDGRVFAIEYAIANDIFQKLKILPQGLLKKLHENLMNEKCKVIKKIGIREIDMDDLDEREECEQSGLGVGLGKDYVILKLNWKLYE